MSMRQLFIVLVCLLQCTGIAIAAQPEGLVARWTFDEVAGNIARDTAGKHHATIFGPKRVKQGRGYALSFDGTDDYIDCGNSKSLGIGGPVSIEAWIKPTRKGHGEACLFGESLGSYLITYYDTEICNWYIAGGDNGINAPVDLNGWNHLVATFDGTTTYLWINGQQAASKQSKFKSYEPGGNFFIATKGRPDLPKFRGLIDDVRIYNRALSREMVMAHYKAEAGNHGFDSRLFDRPKVTPYYYLDRDEIVIEIDYKLMLPLAGSGRVEVTLANKSSSDTIIDKRVLGPLVSRTGVVEMTLPVGRLRDGEYTIRVGFSDDKGKRSADAFVFTYPMPHKPLPSPAKQTVEPLPSKHQPMPFRFRMGKQGGFWILLNGKSYPFESRISWPNGEFNRLSAEQKQGKGAGEKSWRVRTRTAGKGKYIVLAGGKHYKIKRDVQIFPTHVYIKDKYTNITRQDIGLMIYNETPVQANRLKQSLISGYEKTGRQIEVGTPDYGPSIFFADQQAGLGVLPVDDVFIVQAVPYIDWEGKAGVGTERFALAAGQSYTLEWAIYPTGSRDYYDFINNFRQVEDRINTIHGAPGFITYSPASRDQVVDVGFLEPRNIEVGIITCLSYAADDPKLHIEGIEFIDFPKESQRLTRQLTAIHEKNPSLKAVVHIAHSLYLTNDPNRYADSRVILENGKQSSWGNGSEFGDKYQKQGYRWWIFYPTPGNSFHEAMMKSVDYMMDDIGLDGAFMDGFFACYTSKYTYDRWDGHTADIDPVTKTIRRKLGSVLLLSQPSMIEYAKKIHDKGGILLANNSVFTRSIASQKHIIFDNECASGPQLHLAPTVTALALPSCLTAKEFYLDMLDKLKWGALFINYSEPTFFDKLTYKPLSARQYPMTFEEIRSGLVRGPQRIVTMNDGVYGWQGKRDLHLVYKYDQRGAGVMHDYVTTVDSDSVRTQLDFKENESAVIEPIPVVLDTASPVNLRVLHYDASRLRAIISGQGMATLYIRSGELVVKTGDVYRVAINNKTTNITADGDVLKVQLNLSGQIELNIGLDQRTLTVRSSPMPVVAVGGSHPGMTDYETQLDIAENVTLVATQFAADTRTTGEKGFVATQGMGKTVIYDAGGALVKELSHTGSAMAFDKYCNLFIASDVIENGKYPIWRYPISGKRDWGEAEKYCEIDARPRALAVDDTSQNSMIYIGLGDGESLSNVYRCAGRGQAPKLFCGVNNGGRQIQDMQVDADGKVWLGLVGWGYLRFPLSGGFKSELTINNNGQAGGFAFGPDRNGDGKPELYGNTDNSMSSFGYHNIENGRQGATLINDERLGNYCMTFGPDRDDDGVVDIYISRYNDRIRIYSGASGAKLGEMAEGLPNTYITGQVAMPYRFVRWQLNGKNQPIGRTKVSFKMTDKFVANAVYETSQ